MVEITRTPFHEEAASPKSVDSQEAAKFRLVYSKSKVYIHPTGESFAVERMGMNADQSGKHILGITSPALSCW